MTVLTRPPPSATGSLDVVTFRLGGEILAIRAQVLREVLEPVAITRVPQAPEFVQGLINVRGAVVPLADLRVTFGMLRRPLGPDGRILCSTSRSAAAPPWWASSPMPSTR
jgi:purine-binding chemotaxis protein CheW